MLLALLLGLQEVPIVTGRQHLLDSMSADLNAHIATCGTTAAFIIPKGKKQVDDAQAVLDPAATPEQIACAKKVVSWLVTDAEARARGWK
jgi:hypothetical protein